MTTLRTTSLTVAKATHSVLIKLATVHVPNPASQFGLAPGQTIRAQATHDEARLNSALSDLWPGNQVPREIAQIRQRQGTAVAILFSWIVHELLEVYDQNGPSPEQGQHVDLARLLERCNQNDGKDYFVDANQLATLIDDLCTVSPAPQAAGPTPLVESMSIAELLALFGMNKDRGNGKWLFNQHRRGTGNKLRPARKDTGRYDPITAFRIVKERGKATGTEQLTAKRTLATRLGIDIGDFDELIK
jgi:hypothetical protein